MSDPTVMMKTDLKVTVLTGPCLMVIDQRAMMTDPVVMMTDLSVMARWMAVVFSSRLQCTV
jgi:hypothetical protein